MPAPQLRERSHSDADWSGGPTVLQRQVAVIELIRMLDPGRLIIAFNQMWIKQVGFVLLWQRLPKAFDVQGIEQGQAGFIPSQIDIVAQVVK